MKIKFGVVILFFICVVASGCASTMVVSVRPEPNITKSEIGGGNDLAIKINDVRTSKVLGHWHGNVFYDKADIVTRDEVSNILKRAIENGMNSKGFNVAPFRDDHPRRIVVDIVTYEFSQEFGVWLEGVNGKGVLKVKAFKNGKEFERTYSSSSNDNLGIIRQDYVENMLNSMTADLLTKALNDNELISFLVK